MKKSPGHVIEKSPGHVIEKSPGYVILSAAKNLRRPPDLSRSREILRCAQNDMREVFFHGELFQQAREQHQFGGLMLLSCLLECYFTVPIAASGCAAGH